MIGELKKDPPKDDSRLEAGPAADEGKRANVFYRSIQRIKKKKQRANGREYGPKGSTSEQDQVFRPSSSTRPASIAGTKSPGSPRNGTPSSPGPGTDKFYPAHRGSGGAGDKWNPKRGSTGPDTWDPTHRGSAPPDLPRQRRKKRSTSEGKESGFKMPLRCFWRKKSDPLPEPKAKPDHFLDVKLKKTEVEEKVVPKTTEKYKLLEGVYQISLSVVVDEKTEKMSLKPVVSWSHPPLGTTKCHYIAATERNLPDFAFPDLDLLERKKVQLQFPTETYAFVQTDMSAARTIGYCRRFKYRDTQAGRSRSGTDASVQQDKSGHKKLSKSQKSLLKMRVWCIITKLHCFDTFSAIFDEIHAMRREISSNADSEVFSFLQSIGSNPAPLPGHMLPIQYVSKRALTSNVGNYELKRPGPEDRITLLKHVDLLERLPKSMLITIMLGLLTESKILFLDKTLSSLTSTLHALTSLLYPLTWVCIYIPMLGCGIREQARYLVLSPSPYVIGMLKTDYKKVNQQELRDTEVLVVDLTERQMDDMRHEDQKLLPISDSCRKELKKKMRVLKKMKDQYGLSDVWFNFIKPFLILFDEACYDVKPGEHGIRRIPMASYTNLVKEKMPGEERFAKQLFSTQMSQMWLQKNRLSVER